MAFTPVKTPAAAAGARFWAAVCVTVFSVSLGIRLVPARSEGFQHDAIVSQMAAERGAADNALDRGDTFRLRRYHPPLLSYIIMANNRLFGNDPYRARWFSIVFGALACAMCAWATAWLFTAARADHHAGPRAREPAIRSFRVGRVETAAAAALGGGALSLLPVHLYVSRTANWDAVYGFCALAALFASAAYSADRRRRYLAMASFACALAFLTSESAVLLAAPVASVFVMDWRRAGRLDGGRRRVLAPRWIAAVAIVTATVALLWPAGIFELDAARTLRFRWFDSAAGPSNQPWTAFYTTLWHQAPAFTALAVAGALIAPRALRHAPRARRAALPFALYAITAILASTRQRLVYIHHIADLFAPLSVIAAAAVAHATVASRFGFRRLTAPVLAAAFIALSAPSALVCDADIVGPQEHPGLLGIAAYLNDHPTERSYYYYAYTMGYYSPGADVGGDPTRAWTPDDARRAKAGGFDLAIADRTNFTGPVESATQMAATLAPEFSLVHTVTHVRTGDPVAWIFARSEAPAGP